VQGGSRVEDASPAAEASRERVWEDRKMRENKARAKVKEEDVLA
jgi:hypothetical protein